MLPKISIITPSFNQGHFIEQTITSILDQGYPNLEYIIMDGGSTDNTVEVIKKYEKDISFWVSEKDRGQSHAINKGFEKATGDIINWLNSDDYYEPGTLDKVSKAFTNPNINVSCGRSRVFGNGQNYLTNGTDIYSGNVHRTVGQARIDQPETFFRHAALKEVGPVNECLHFTMDKELWIRYLLRYGLDNVVKLPDVWVNYRLHGNSKTVSLQQKFAEESRNIYYTFARWFSLSSFARFLEDRYAVKELPLQGYDGLMDKDTAYRIVNYFFLEQALIHYAGDDYKQAKHFIQQVVRNELTEAERTELDKISFRMKLPLTAKRLFHLLQKMKKG